MTVREFDSLVARIMKDCEKDGEPVTIDEAKEMARMEIKAGGNKSHAEESKPRKKREAKKDPEKLALIAKISHFLKDNGYDTTIVNDTRQIDFGQFSLTLVKHKSKKDNK